MGKSQPLLRQDYREIELKCWALPSVSGPMLFLSLRWSQGQRWKTGQGEKRAWSLRKVVPCPCGELARLGCQEQLAPGGWEVSPPPCLLLRCPGFPQHKTAFSAMGSDHQDFLLGPK